jgi:hypothetical protein
LEIIEARGKDIVRDAEFISASLTAANKSLGYESTAEYISFIAQDDQGCRMGGTNLCFKWGWCLIDDLVALPEYKACGVGRSIMLAVEKKRKKKKQKGSWLFTGGF